MHTIYSKSFFAWIICLLYLLAAFSKPLNAQEYSYLHYDTKDGLPGPVVHGITQDRDGFMWFCTETGLSRFDGKRFRNFTRSDGLPSNEIFSVFADSRNRLWISSFKNAICYYYKGKIHNQQNDPVLRRIKLDGKVDGFLETEEGDIIVNVSKLSIIIPLKDRAPIRQIPFEQQLAPGFPLVQISSSMFRLPGLSPMSVPRYMRKLLRSNKGYYVSDRTPVRKNHRQLYSISNEDSLFIVNGGDTTLHTLKSFPARTIRRCIFLDDSLLIVFPKKAGVLIFNMNNGKQLYSFMPHTRVHDLFRDREGNFWFSTNGQGVYLLCNPSFVTYTFEKAGQPSAVFSISKPGNTFHIMTSYGMHWRMEANSGNVHGAPLRPPVAYRPSLRQLMYLAQSPVSYSDINFSDMFHGKRSVMVIKTIQAFHDTLLLASANGAYLISLPGLQVIDTLYPRRATCALKAGTTYYLGTTDGLYMLMGAKPGNSSLQPPVLEGRISALAQGRDGTVWVSTHENGIAGFRNGRLTTRITKAGNGLSSDMCRCLFPDGPYLWAGTGSGLHKIDISRKQPVVVARYDVTDGLRSDIINAVYADGAMVYAGTAAGLTCFNETGVARYGPCSILLTGIKVSRKELPDTAGSLIDLPHESNNIHVEYAGISFRSAGHMRYRYRLKGLQENWQTTTESFLDYPSLPSGTYTLQLQAINKFGIASPVLERQLSIRKMLWERTGIQVAGILLLLAATVMLTVLRQKQVQKKEQEARLIQQKMMDLEHMAMRAQMNPHFIFNCLNSIQAFILDQDARGANFYLNRFAVMVRQTLQNVSRKNISLKEEIAYLSGYLDLEQLQMTETFRYTIDLADRTPTEDISLPVMILQPFVENAVKHGVSKLGSEGTITLSFRVTGKVLECIITDNGPGILSKKDMEQRKQHISMGMTITRERIDLLNQLSGPGMKISLHTDWAFREETKCYGTKITLCFPV